MKNEKRSVFSLILNRAWQRKPEKLICMSGFFFGNRKMLFNDHIPREIEFRAFACKVWAYFPIKIKDHFLSIKS
jgi:hypothetical protein